MVITKTPYRISLFGGGTDHPAWYKKHGGEVISFAIDKYCYLATRVIPPYFDFKYRILYSKNETTSNVDDICRNWIKRVIIVWILFNTLLVLFEFGILEIISSNKSFDCVSIL